MPSMRKTPSNFECQACGRRFPGCAFIVSSIGRRSVPQAPSTCVPLPHPHAERWRERTDCAFLEKKTGHSPNTSGQKATVMDRVMCPSFLLRAACARWCSSRLRLYMMKCEATCARKKVLGVPVRERHALARGFPGAQKKHCVMAHHSGAI